MTEPGAVVAMTLQWVRSPLTHSLSTGVTLAVEAFFGLAYLTLGPFERPLGQHAR
jgi:hypothetical protein